MPQSYLTLERISKTYRAKVPVTALKNISLDISMGWRLAIFGKSGAFPD
ncbi:MAG: hypothetical protein U9P07_12785 [Pseudomonadota bacterium]|nr:hypothetical protein [Pseudomonadota bacterium]